MRHFTFTFIISGTFSLDESFPCRDIWTHLLTEISKFVFVSNLWRCLHFHPYDDIECNRDDCVCRFTALLTVAFFTEATALRAWMGKFVAPYITALLTTGRDSTQRSLLPSVSYELIFFAKFEITWFNASPLTRLTHTRCIIYVRQKATPRAVTVHPCNARGGHILKFNHIFTTWVTIDLDAHGSGRPEQFNWSATIRKTELEPVGRRENERTALLIWEKKVLPSRKTTHYGPEIKINLWEGFLVIVDMCDCWSTT